MVKNSDLHTHSYYSDGVLAPRKIVALAKGKKIKYLALTDHNSIQGIAEALSRNLVVDPEALRMVREKYEEFARTKKIKLGCYRGHSHQLHASLGGQHLSKTIDF
jgi:histidinol phosphatase-like PHP family hydrolase